MIRNVLFLALATVVTTATVATTAFAEPGDISAQRRFDVRGFHAVELASSDTVRIVPGGAFAVSAAGDPRAVASLVVERRGPTLLVSRTPGRHDDRGATVTVALPSLSGVTLSGSGAIDVGRVSGASFAVRLPGSGQVLTDEIRVEEATVELGGSGFVTLGGSAGRVDIRLGGSGRVDAGALGARDLTVRMGGSGSIRAAATGTAHIDASGSGSIRVDGHPACSVSRSGVARVTCG